MAAPTDPIYPQYEFTFAKGDDQDYTPNMYPFVARVTFDAYAYYPNNDTATYVVPQGPDLAAFESALQAAAESLANHYSGAFDTTTLRKVTGPPSTQIYPAPESPADQ